MSTKRYLAHLWRILFVRFLCIGVINTLTDLAILNSLIFLGRLPILLANCISAAISISLGYFWNHHFVFQKKEDKSLGSFVRFFMVTGIGVLVIQTAVMYIVLHDILTVGFVEALGGHGAHAVSLVRIDGAKVAAILCAMLWNFSLYRLVVFRDRQARKTVAMLSSESA